MQYGSSTGSGISTGSGYGIRVRYCAAGVRDRRNSQRDQGPGNGTTAGRPGRSAVDRRRIAARWQAWSSMIKLEPFEGRLNHFGGTRADIRGGDTV